MGTLVSWNLEGIKACDSDGRLRSLSTTDVAHVEAKQQAQWERGGKKAGAYPIGTPKDCASC